MISRIGNVNIAGRFLTWSVFINARRKRTNGLFLGIEKKI